MKTNVMSVLFLLIWGGQVMAAEPLTPLTLQLNWLPNVQFAGVLLAKERGWYAEAGIDLTVNSWGDGISPIHEVVSGKAQIAISEGAEFIKARSEGAPLIAIAAQFQKSPFCLISKKGKGIQTPAQLAGKKIGIPDSETTMMINVVLARQGIPFEQIIPVTISWDVHPLIDDQIDVLAGYMSDEILTLKELGHEVEYLPAFQHGYDFYSNVYLVSETILRDQPERVRAFLDVTLRGWQETLKDPAAAAQLIVEKYDPNGSVAHQTESLKIFQMLALLGDSKKYIGWMEERYWQKGIDILAEFHQIDKKIPASDVFTMDVLNAVYFGK